MYMAIYIKLSGILQCLFPLEFFFTFVWPFSCFVSAEGISGYFQVDQMPRM